MGTKVTATYLTSNAMDWIHLAPHGIAFQVTPELLRAYLAPDVDWGDWKPSLHDDGVAGPVESYGEPIAVRHDTKPVEVLNPDTWGRQLAFHEVAPITYIDWDTTSDPSNPGWVASQGPFCFRGILDGLGCYNDGTFSSPEQVIEHLLAANLLDLFGEVNLTCAALDHLAELAIEHREHWPEHGDRWPAALQVARDCGAKAARQPWLPSRVLNQALTTAWLNQALINAWLAGYEAVRNAEGVDDA